MSFFIKDWADNTCFGGLEFKDFDDAEDFLCEKLGNEYETDRQEYYITEGTPREKRYLDPKDPRVRL